MAPYRDLTNPVSTWVSFCNRPFTFNLLVKTRSSDLPLWPDKDKPNRRNGGFHFHFMPRNGEKNKTVAFGRVLNFGGGHKHRRPRRVSPPRRNDGEKERREEDPRVLGEHPRAYGRILVRARGGACVKTMKRRLDNFARVPWIFSARAGRERGAREGTRARHPRPSAADATKNIPDASRDF